MKNKISIFLITMFIFSALSVNAAEIPIESYPATADNESVAVAEHLIGGILDDVQNGLGYQEAWCTANNTIFFAVLAHETNDYGYGVLADIARNAILQCRDMYLRPDYYAEIENKVRVLIADLITEVENGTKDYTTAEKEAYTKIYKLANPRFNPETDCVGDFCYWDIPPVDSAMLTQARKLLKNALFKAEQVRQ